MHAPPPEAGRRSVLLVTGTQYAGNLYSGPTLWAVNMGGSEAKIENALDSFVQLKPIGDQLNTETMLEGTLTLTLIQVVEYREDARIYLETMLEGPLALCTLQSTIYIWR